MVALNSHGEIIDVNEADQFPLGKSQFECGFFACAIARSMAPVGAPPTLSAAQIIADAEGWYAQYDGTNAITNTNGMTTAQLYNLLAQIGLHYQSTATDINVVKQWVQAGYPVIIAITEVSVHDLALGGANPYPWTASGTHIILVTGVPGDGNVLVRDSANCTSLNDPNSLRPGPRPYDASKLQLVSATVVVPPWMPRPASATPPAPGSPGMLALPKGWTDDGTTLKGPSGIPVIGVIRAHVRPRLLEGSWLAVNDAYMPQQTMQQLEASNKDLGGGIQQIFLMSMLCVTPAGVLIVEYVGKELAYLRTQYETLWNAYQKLQAAPAPAQQAPVDPRIAQYAAKLAAVTLLLTQAQQAAAL